MAIRSDNTLISNSEMALELVLVPFRAIGNFIYTAMENNSRVQTLQAINAISDDELRTRGLTRAEVVAMTFRHDA